MWNYDFQRYLTAKKTVDDRALNRSVSECMVRTLRTEFSFKPLRVLEVGCGTGTMLDRLGEWGVFRQASYLGIDSDPANIAYARGRFLGEKNQPSFENQPGLESAFQVADVVQFWQEPVHAGRYDLLVAHAFLDLLDIPAALPELLKLLAPGGYYYFTINFDGDTIFQPELDLKFEAQLVDLYHRSMDERQVNGAPSGDSRAGRHLFAHLEAAGAQILEAGPSDWVVFPRDGVYPGDEAYFLAHILHFFETTLAGTPGLDEQRFHKWLKARRLQIEQGQLVYIAHQLDFFGKIPAI